MSATNQITKQTPQSSCDCTVLGICLYTSDLGIGKCPTPGSGLNTGGGAITAPGSGNPVTDYWNNLTHGGNPVSAAWTSGTDIGTAVNNWITGKEKDATDTIIRVGLIIVGIVFVVIGFTKLFSHG